MVTWHMHRSNKGAGEACIAAGIGSLGIAVVAITYGDFKGAIEMVGIAAAFITIGVLIIRWDKKYQEKKAKKEKEMKESSNDNRKNDSK